MKAVVLGSLLAALPLGWAQAQVSVSPGGTPGYSTPIKAAPGVAGMTPSLAIGFSGGGGNGPLGPGWAIQGFSVITRCGGIVASDGAPKTVTFTSADKLCLDGQRLIRTDAAGNPQASTPGANGALADASGWDGGYAEFRTEKDSFARIRAYGSAGGLAANGPLYFRVWTKSGQIYDYGAAPGVNPASDALVKAQGKDIAVAWAVTRISDTLGNYMDFLYGQRDVAWGTGPSGAKQGHEWNLAEVQYSGNSVSSAMPQNRIVFEYEDRTETRDRSEAYHQGSKNVSIQRLKAVRSYINWPGPAAAGAAPPPSTALVVRTLKLGYESSPVTGRSRLTSLTECVGKEETKCQQPTRFGYSGNDATQGETYERSTAFASSQLANVDLMGMDGKSGVITGDFFGTGRQDILRWNDTPGQNELWRSTGDGGFTKVDAFNITDEKLFDKDGCYNSLLTDFNGDGLPDILRYSGPTSMANANCSTYGAVYAYINKGDGSFTRSAIASTPSSGAALRLTRSKALVDNCGYKATQGDGDRRQCADDGLWYHTGWTEGTNFFLIDVDGDGRIDILTTQLPPSDPRVPVIRSDCTFGGTKQDGCTQYWKGIGDGTFDARPTNLKDIPIYVEPNGATGIGAPRNVADVDGDGLADLVALPIKYFNKKAAFRSSGDGNFEPGASNLACDAPGDFNGDGRTDCLSIADSVENNALQIVIGGGAFEPTSNFNLKTAGFELKHKPDASEAIGSSIADFNGDGRDDVMRWSTDRAKNTLYLSNGDGTFSESTTFKSTFSGVNLMHGQSDPNAIGVFRAASFQLGNFSGRGQMELLRMGQGDIADMALGLGKNQLYVKKNSQPVDQLLTVTAPNGLVTRLSYALLSNSSTGMNSSGAAASFYPARYKGGRENNAAASYPKLDVTMPMHVVATVETDSGVGTATLKTEYAYENLRAVLGGRGMLGFERVSQQSSAPNGETLTVVTQYLQDHPYTGVAGVSQTFLGSLGSGGSLLSRTTNAYCEKNSAGTPTGISTGGTAPAPCLSALPLIVQPYLHESLEEGWDLNGAALPTVKTTNTYNASGDPLTIKVEKKGVGAGLVQSFTKNVANTYEAADMSCTDIASCSWVLGRLSKATVTNTVPNSLASIATAAGNAAGATATQGALNIAPPAVVLGFTPTSIAAFAATGIGQSADSATVTLRNTGTQSAAGLTLSAPAGFSIQSSTCTTSLAANAMCTFVVRFAPTEIQPYAGSVTASAVGATAELSVSGTGVAGPKPVLSFAPATIAAFATTPTGQTADSATVTLTNTGTQAASDLALSAPAGFSLQSSTCAASLAVNASCSFVVRFAPTAAQSYGGNVAASATGAAAIALPVTGNSVAASTVAVLTSPAAQTFEESWLNGQSKTLSYGYRNDGNVAMTLATPSLAAPLSVTSNGCSNVAPGAGCTIVLSRASNIPGVAQSQAFTPAGATTAPAAATATWTVKTAIARWSVTSLAFPDTTVGSSATQSLTLHNDGNWSINWAAMNQIENPPAGFAFDTSACSNVVAGGSCPVTVTFTPTSNANFGGSGIRMHDLNGFANTLSVSGKGVPLVNSIAVLTSAASQIFEDAWLNGAAKTLAYGYRNDGTTPMTLMSPSLAAPLSVASNDCTNVAANASCTIVLSRAATTLGIAQSQSFTPAGATTAPAAAAATWTVKGVIARWSTTALNFGDTLVGTSSTQNLTLHNDGNWPIDWATQNQLDNVPAGYAFNTSACANVAAGGSCAVTVTFTPTGADTVAGSGIRMREQQGTANTLSISGKGIASAAVLTSAASQTFEESVLNGPAKTLSYSYRNDGTAPMTLASPSLSAPLSVASNDCTNVAAGNSCTIVLSRASNIAGIAQSQTFTPNGATTPPAAATAVWTVRSVIARWSATSLSFGDTPRGKTVTQNVTLHNDGNTAVNWATLNQVDTVPNGFAFNTSACTNVVAGGSCAVVVSFSPTAVASYGGSGIRMREQQGAANTLAVSGNGVPASAAVLTSEAAQAFPEVWVGGPVHTLSYGYRNDGDAAMTLASPSLVAPLSVTGNSCTNVAPGASCAIVISRSTGMEGIQKSQTFTPSGAAFAPAMATAIYAVKSALPFWGASRLDFPDTLVGQTSTLTVKLANQGNVPVDWSKKPLLNAPAGFSFDLSTCTAVLGNNCTVTVRFTPTAATTYGGGGIRVPDASGYSGPDLTVAGRGISPTPSVATLISPASQSFAPVWYGTGYSAALNYIYRNDGDGLMTLTWPNPGSGLFQHSNNCQSIPRNGQCTISVGRDNYTAALDQSVSFKPNGATSGPVQATATWSVYMSAAKWGSPMLDFGFVAVGASKTLEIQLSNQGNWPVNWATNNTVLNAPAGYSFDTSACSSVGAWGMSCTVKVTLRPTYQAVFDASGVVMRDASQQLNGLILRGRTP